MDIVLLLTFHLFLSFFLGRVYSGRSNDDLSHLSSCVLIDERPVDERPVTLL